MENNFEKLPPETLLEQLLIRKQQLEVALDSLKASIKLAPEGHLRITTNKGTRQCYNVCEPGHKNGRYIPKKNWKLAKQLAQKEYDQKVAGEIQRQVDGIIALEKVLQGHGCSAEYETLPSGKKAFVEPVTLPPEDYAKLWQAQKYEGKAFMEGAPQLFTAKGERVRSKSEVIIADTLGRLEIPYRYEFPLKLKKYTVHPDFYCLNLRNRQEFAWEHFGMMDDPEYAANSVQKIAAYETAGYFMGKNLLITMETADNPLSSKQVEKLAKEFLLA